MKIYIRQIPTTMMNEIYFVQGVENLRKGSVIRFINIKEDGEVIAKEKIHDYGMDLSEYKPTMILSEQDTRELISAFMEIGKENGIVPPNESEAKGQLKAQTEHLKDLRKLLKLTQ